MKTPLQGIAPLLIVGIIAGIALLGGIGYGGYWLDSKLTVTQSDLASTTAANATLANSLADQQKQNADLTDRYNAALAKNGDFEHQISDITSTVGRLTKLTQTDKELLQKYSRVYFLNENYTPSALSPIDSNYILQPTRTYQIHAKVKPFLENMLADAKDAGVPILVLSSYRSFGEQAALKNSYKVSYGSGSNKFSADQGYSEHQLGTAVDLTTSDIAGTSVAFAKSSAGAWMDANAYKYGFILSYPAGNTFYQYEPWHWRFVGVSLATYLHNTNVHFYDMAQRDIDTYLVSIFD